MSMENLEVFIGRKIKDYQSIDIKFVLSDLKSCGLCAVELDGLPMIGASAKGRVFYAHPNPHKLGQKKIKSVRWDVPLMLFHNEGRYMLMPKCAITRITDDGFCFEVKAVVGKHLAGMISGKATIKED